MATNLNFFSGASSTSPMVGQHCSIDDMFCIPANYSKFNPPLNPPGESATELQQIIRIIRYSNNWDQIVLFIFGIWSICNFRIIFEYPNSCYRIPNSYRLFIKQNVYKKYRKKLLIATKIKNQILLFSFSHKFNLWNKY